MKKTYFLFIVLSSCYFLFISETVLASCLQTVENYFSSQKTFSAQFRQEYPGSHSSKGFFYFSRPDRFRFEYENTPPLTILSNGYHVIYHDRKMKNATYFNLKNTPLYTFISSKVSLNNERTKVDFCQENATHMTIKMIPVVKNQWQEFILVLKKNPLILKKWIITDAQNKKVTVYLSHQKTNIKIDPKLFKFNRQWSIK